MPRFGIDHTQFAVLCVAVMTIAGKPDSVGATTLHSGATASLDLSGGWAFAMDPKDIGEKEQWFSRELPGTIRLPGSMAEQNLGDPVTTSTQWTGDIQGKDWTQNPIYKEYAQPDNFKFPFWLTPLKYYVGPAWYQRTIDVPQEWSGNALRLHLERPHWRTTVWVDSQIIGTRDSLSTPHEYDVPVLSVGTHTLTVCVDNRLQAAVGVNAHSVSDHTQTNWNGLVGKLELRPLNRLVIDDLQLYPGAAADQVRVVTKLTDNSPNRPPVKLLLECFPRKGSRQSLGSSTHTFEVKSTTSTVEHVLSLTSPALRWDEFNPALYEIRATVTRVDAAGETSDTRSTTFGFRDFKTSGTQFTINGRPMYLRGTLECAIFPLTGYPPTDVGAWRRIIRTARAHGLNHLRFHSWCPPEAAFVAADEEGFYYSIECASWAAVGDDPHYDKWLYAEADRILQAYGNHPSFCMMLYGNEPAGKKQKEFLAKFVDHWKQKDPRRLYSSGAGWPMLDENEFHVTPDPRVQRWGEGLKSRINARPPETLTDYRDYIAKRKAPVISHEIGQWCVYPNFEERTKYTGGLRALNFDIFADSLARNHMGNQARDFLRASGKLQTLCYKEDIESALRTPGMAGFQLLDLHDFPGQGTALVGVLDPFWDEKGYVTAEEYRRFSGETVPLARLGKRVWSNDETLTASIQVTHFGASPLHDPVPAWVVRGRDGAVIKSGHFAQKEISIGSAIPLGEIAVPLSELKEAQKLTLEVSLSGPRVYSNSWDLWVYPAAPAAAAPADVLITRRLDSAAQKTLAGGGKVLFIPAAGAVKGDENGPVQGGFSSIFWNTAWTRQQAPHTLGILCDPAHPALAQFPTEYHSNWQWWYVIHRAQFMILDSLPSDVRPLIQVIDDWVTNRRLGLAFEAKCGGGKLLVCAVDLEADLSEDPVTRQLRESLLKYMSSSTFDPKQDITHEQLAGVVNPD